MHPSRDGCFIFNGHPIPRGGVIANVITRRWSMFRIGVLLSLCLLGVNGFCQTELYPTTPIITDGSDLNFGFEGHWKPIDGLMPRQKTPKYQLSISREGDGKSYLVGVAGNDAGGDNASVQLRVHTLPLHQGSGKAVIQIQSIENTNAPYRRIAVATVNDDVLSLWKLDAKNLGQCIFDDGHSAVIEHFHFYTILRCKPEHL